MESEVNKILHRGYELITDLLSQANNLSVSFSKEAEERGSDGITSRALKTSLVMIISNSLEAFCNITSQLIVYTCTQDENFKDKISQTEIDFLLEQETYLYTRTGELKISKKKYSSILDKIAIIPLVFARIHGDTFRVDKGNEHWRRIVKFKEIRDESTHIKFDITKIILNFDLPDDITKRSPVYHIDNKHLFFGIESIREYVFTINNIVRKYYPSQTLLMGVIDLLYWMTLMNLREACGIAENEINKLRTPPVDSKEKHDIA